MRRIPPDDLTVRLAAIVSQFLRQPAGTATDADTGDPLLDFDPPLTAGELIVLARLTRLARSLVLGITPAEWLALEPRLDEIRTFRLRTPAQWNALSAANREADEIAYLNDLTDVLRAMLRS